MGEIQRNVATTVDPVKVRKKDLEYWTPEEINREWSHTLYCLFSRDIYRDAPRRNNGPEMGFGGLR